MNLQRRPYTHKFKLRVLQEADTGMRISPLVREPKVQTTLIHRWRQQLRRLDERAFPGIGEAVGDETLFEASTPTWFLVLWTASSMPESEPENLLDHTDRGVLCAYKVYVNTLKNAGKRNGMGRCDNTNDNAKVERFFKPSKTRKSISKRLKLLKMKDHTSTTSPTESKP